MTTQRRLVEDKTEERDERLERESALQQYSQYAECETAFIPWLRERVEELEVEMEQSIHSHPDLCAIQGKKQEVRRIIEVLEKLRTGDESWQTK